MARRNEIAEKRSRNASNGWDQFSKGKMPSRGPSNDDVRSNRSFVSKKTYVSNKTGKPVGSKFKQNAQDKVNQMRASKEKESFQIEKKASFEKLQANKNIREKKYLDNMEKKK